jgi:hypothetical protein
LGIDGEVAAQPYLHHQSKSFPMNANGLTKHTIGTFAAGYFRSHGKQKLTFSELRERRRSFNKKIRAAAEEILAWSLATGMVFLVVELIRHI